jgi:hypothetical protein
MRQKLNVTIAIELTEGDFTKNVTDFITDLERNARETWGEDAEGGYEGPFIDTMTTTVQVADAATLPMPESDEYNPKVTLSRTTTKTVEQTRAGPRLGPDHAGPRPRRTSQRHRRRAPDGVRAGRGPRVLRAEVRRPDR